jgi:hypothetical protein
MLIATEGIPSRKGYGPPCQVAISCLNHFILGRSTLLSYLAQSPERLSNLSLALPAYFQILQYFVVLLLGQLVKENGDYG